MSQPGWYPDPSAPATLRWWDGGRWTSSVQAAGPDPGTDLAEEAKTGRWAALALAAGVIVYCAQYAVDVALFSSIAHSIRTWQKLPDNPDGTRPPLVLSHAMAINLASSVTSLALLAVGVVFLIWFWHAVNVARNLGLPARRNPSWAMAGWFLPIVSLWFPYQAARDLLPPGHPGRHLVKRWWALWLATEFIGVVALVASLFSAASGWTMAVIGAAVAIGAGVAGRAVISEVNQAHARLLGR
jgi:hypothetical protein